MPTDPRVDAYIERQADFARPILVELRARVTRVCPEVEETLKWSRPAFLWRGRLLAGMAAFKTHATFDFWDRDALTTGREGEALGHLGRIERIEDLPDRAHFAQWMAIAMARIDAGDRPARSRAARPEAVVPPELAAALAGAPKARATFEGFPPGARREYCDWIADAKRPATRDKRISEAIGWLREGKRRNRKYENC